jgi:hypothetical protein
LPGTSTWRMIEHASKHTTFKDSIPDRRMGCPVT